MTYDGILEKVEKTPVGKRWAGTIPLNPKFKEYLDHYFTVGEILEEFCGVEGASKDPNLAYRRDTFFFQWMGFIQNQQQIEQQAAQIQQGASDGAAANSAQQEAAKESNLEESVGSEGGENNMDKTLGKAMNYLKKTEGNRLSEDQKKVVTYQETILKDLELGLEEDFAEFQEELKNIHEKHTK